jgi:cytochrome d ubiquinol oxidase subunit II
LLRVRRTGLAFIASAIVQVSVVFTAGVSLFPFLMPSSSAPSSSLTIWDASSSQSTLFTMLIAALIFVPIVLTYTAWVFHVLRGKTTLDEIRQHTAHY